MFTNQWGPHAWVFLHSISFQYPEKPTQKDKLIYKNFFESIQDILPCPKCKAHYSENIKKYPIQLNSRLHLIKWLIKIHNNVNISLHKKSLSFNDVQSLYLHKYNYSIINNIHIKNNNHILKLLLLIIILLYIYYIYNS